MSDIHVSAIGYVHGDRRNVSELDDENGELETLAAEIPSYRSSDRDIWQLAAAAAQRTLDKATGPPDLLMYVSENDPDTTGSLARILEQLDLTTVEHMAVSGHDCGNLGPTLRMAGSALRARACERILLVLADRALAGRRTMANGLSVLSDGAASCLVTNDAQDTDGPQFAVQTVETRTRVHLDAAPAPGEAILATVRLAKDSVADVFRATNGEASDFGHVVFGNYRPAAQTFLAAAMGLAADKVLLGSVTDLGHCFSADILVTLDHQRSASTLVRGERILAAVTGPYSWSTMALRCL